jgi:guanylate kinase
MAQFSMIRSLVVCGPSGVGKGTLISMLQEKYAAKFGFTVSHTTRKPREGEVNGVDYHFVSKEAMENAIERGEFIEHAQVHSNIYGTSFEAVTTVVRSNRLCILDLDINGVRQLKARDFPGKFLFVNPPSIDELERRLRGRGTESEEQMKIRLTNAKDEIAYAHSEEDPFDRILTNGDSREVTFQKLCVQVEEWFPELRNVGENVEENVKN